MKIIDTSPKPLFPEKSELTVKVIRLYTSELLDIVKSYSEESTFKVLRFKSAKHEQTQLENVDEVETYLASIRLPVSIEFDDFSISIERGAGAKITSQLEKKHLAQKVFLDLARYKPWYAVLKNKTAYLLAILWAFPQLFFDYSLLAESFDNINKQSLEEIIGVASFIALIVILVQGFFIIGSGVLRLGARDGLLARTKDGIFLTLVGILLGLLIPELFRWLTEK